MFDESNIYQLVKNIYGCRAELVAIYDGFIRLKLNENMYFWDKESNWKPLDFVGPWYS